MKVTGKLKNKDITILIDGRNTHNFIDQSIVSRFDLQVVRDKTLQVMVGNGEKIDCSSLCLATTLVIQELSIQVDFYVLLVAACQAVLGVQWLETLGPIEMDYKKLTMSFHLNGAIRTLQGLIWQPLTVLSDKELLNLEGVGFFLQIVPGTQQKDEDESSPDIHQLLAEFHHVFSEPDGLPPRRIYDHQIPLQPNHQPVSVRPYRYPYF